MVILGLLLLYFLRWEVKHESISCFNEHILVPIFALVSDNDAVLARRNECSKCKTVCSWVRFASGLANIVQDFVKRFIIVEN